MKKALIITYYWPPAGGGGVQRIAKYCKYLGEFGWEPIILTVKDGNYTQQDTSLVEDVKNVQHVAYAPSWEPHTLYRKLTSSKPARKKASHSNQKSNTLGELIRLNLFIPDSRIGWYRNGCRMGSQLIQELDIDLIFSSAPPYTPHLIAKHLKQKYALPWVADFRDPWLENHAYNTAPRLAMVKSLTRKLEKSVLDKANLVISANERLGKLLSSKLPSEATSKFKVITNGYDDQDIRKHEAQADRFYISHFGTIYPQGFPIVLFEALRELIKEDPVFAEHCRVRIVGDRSPVIQKIMEETIPPRQLETAHYMSHACLLNTLYEEQILILIINDFAHNEATVPGKVYEYLPTGNPILGLGPVPGDASDILEKTRRGQMLTSQDKKGIKTYLSEQFRKWRERKMGNRVQQLPDYERKSLTKSLARLFDRVG